MEDKRFILDLPEGFVLQQGITTKEGVSFLYLTYNGRLVDSFNNQITKPSVILKKCQEIKRKREKEND